MVIKDVVQPRPDVLAGNFQGDLRAYRVGREADASKLENDPDLFFAVTFPSGSLKRFVQLVHQKLTGERDQGAFLPIGRMGSGKTHALITLYNLFAYPERGAEWLQQYDLPDLSLEDSRAVMISAQEDQAEHLWEPVFRRAGREDLLSQVKDYPTISQIKALVGERTAEGSAMAIFIDEIEDWYGSFADDEARQSRNRGFLQNLTEVASEPGYNLFLFISLLDRKPELKKLLQRTGAMTENMVAVGERWAIVQHRLFANRDEEQSRKIAEAYLSNYGEYATTELSVETMVQLYPFHPGLFTTLKEIYAARTQQGIRDTLRTLADLVVMHQDKHDLLLVSDVPADKLLSIDPDLHTALQEDIERCQGIKNADALLSTIFFYSLRPRMPGATTEEVVQSLLRPSGSINGVIMPLQDLDGRAFHLQSNGRFQITPDMNVYAVVRAEVGDVEDEDAKAKIDKLLTDDVFGGQVNLLSELDEVDDRRLKVVIAPHDMSDDEINATLGTLKWPNRVVLVVPKAFVIESIYDHGDNLGNAKRVVAEERLLSGQRRDVDDLRDELLTIKNDEDLPRLLENLRGAYGRYVQWMMTSDRLSKRTVKSDLEEIKRRAVAGLDAAYDQILSVLEEQDFIEVRYLIDNFFKVRRYPVVKGREDIEDALRDLYRDREVGFKGLKQNYLPGRDTFPLGVHQGITVARYDVLKEREPKVEEGKELTEETEEVFYPPPGEGPRRIQEGKDVDRGVDDVPEPAPAPRTISIVGRTPMGLQEVGPADEVHGATIVVDEHEPPLTKKELADLISGLPKGKVIRLQLEVVQRD
jgi:hypothetical protein